MKRSLIPVLVYMFLPLLAAMAAGVPVEVSDEKSQNITTALDHLTVIEYDEAVTQAAVGSPAFQIERQDNKVFIKPLRTGASTNLFIWTASNQRFCYELSVGDVASMVAEIHIAVPKSAPVPDANAQIEQLANKVVTRTLMGIEPVDTARVKNAKEAIDVRFEEVFRGQATVFIRYAVVNHSGRPYRVVSPTLYEVKVDHPAVSLDSLKGVQLDERLIDRLGSLREVPILNARAESTDEDIAPGARQQGIIAVPLAEGVDSPVIVRLVLAGNVKATMVL